MAEALGVSRQEVVLDQEEIANRERDFNKVLRKLSPEQQDVVSELTSVLMESDIYNNYKGNSVKIEELGMSLGLVGLKPKQKRTVLRYLNLA